MGYGEFLHTRRAGYGARQADAGSQDGELFMDMEERAHTEPVTDLQMSPDGTYFVTASKDKSAKVSATKVYQRIPAYHLRLVDLVRGPR